MSGLSALRQPAHTPSQHIAQLVADLDADIGALERTRPSMSISDADPTAEAPAAGSQHLNKAQARLWIYTGSRWVLRSASHAFASDTSAYSTASTTGQLVGPAITLQTSTWGLVALAVDVTMNAGTAGQFADVWVDDSASIGTYRIMRSAGGTASARYGLQPGRLNGLTPYGGLMVFKAPAGSHTFTLGYSVTGGAAGNFSNRRIMGFTF